MPLEKNAPPSCRIVLSGSSGLVGKRLRYFLDSSGRAIRPLVRRTPQPGSGEIRWRPREGEIDAAGLEGAEAVVHLAGENIQGRWTLQKKERILISRRRGTDLLSRTLAYLDSPPKVLVSASAVGYYGHTGERPVDESSPPGDGFLADVCQQWENATRPAREAGIRTVRLRLGMVLAAEGGALKQMLPIFRLGLGGRLGTGRQFMSWIHMVDLLRIIERALDDEQLSGPVNAVAPDPVTNRQFTEQLGSALHRPARLPVPAFALRLLYGSMADEMLLSGQRAIPAKLMERQFKFWYPQLQQALRQELS